MSRWQCISYPVICSKSEGALRVDEHLSDFLIPAECFIYSGSNMCAAPELAAGFKAGCINFNGGLLGHSMYALQLDRQERPAASSSATGIDGFSQAFVSRNDDLLFREQYSIGLGKPINASQVSSHWD